MGIPRPLRSGGISIALVVAMVAIIFLGMSATSSLRRGVTRQLQTLVHNMELVAIAEAALHEVANEGFVQAQFDDAAQLDKLATSFKTGTMSGGVLLPAPTNLTRAPTGTRQQFAADTRVAISDVEIIPVEYRPRLGKGTLRFLVGVTLTENNRVFAKKVAEDYFVAFAGADPEDPDTPPNRKITVIMASNPKARIYP